MEGGGGGNDSSALGGQPDSSFGYGMVYNPMDPYNMYPHHETGEKVYGPPPLFGINKHDPLNMQPFNPNVFSGLVGGVAPAVPMTPAMHTMGPNPFTPLLQPMTPTPPMAPGVPMAPPPMNNPLMMAAALSTLTGDSSFAPAGADPSSSSSFAPAGADPSSSSSFAPAGADPSSSYYFNPVNPYFLDPFATHVVSPQYAHPTDPNNQYPNPLTGSLTQPGPALAGGYNRYDPQNLIGAPPAANDRERALEHNRAVMQAQSPYAPYRMQQVPVPK